MNPLSVLHVLEFARDLLPYATAELERHGDF